MKSRMKIGARGWVGKVAIRRAYAADCLRLLHIEQLETRLPLAVDVSLVRDINSVPELWGSDPSNLTKIGNKLFFVATTNLSGQELWVSDGTPGGTTLVKDIHPGTASSNVNAMTNVNGILYFTANDGSNGLGIWRSGGTTETTEFVARVRGHFGNSSLSNLTAVGDKLFFIANNGDQGYEIWRLNDQANGVLLVKDINPRWSQSSGADNLVNLNGTLLFRANDGINGNELWRSDGTTEGTALVADISSGSASSNLQDLRNINGTLYFRANDGSLGYELWKSDGTSANTVLVKDIFPGPQSGNPQEVTESNGVLYFRAQDGLHGYELWRTDGTESGTGLVRDLRTGPLGASPGLLTNVSGTLFFAANDGISGSELWKLDVSNNDTSLVKDLRPGGSGVYSISNFTNHNGMLFFRCNDGTVTGDELWRSDGTSAGTFLLRNIHDGQFNSNHIKHLTSFEGKLFFKANNRRNGYELWASQGTAETTQMFKDIRSGTHHANPSGLTNVNGTLFFHANDASHGYQIWKSEGNLVDTRMVREGVSYPNFNFINWHTNVNGLLYFVTGTYENELWVTDGTSAGTRMVKKVEGPRYLTNVNGTLYFRAYDGNNGVELWKSDGTESGTVMVRDIFSGVTPSYPNSFSNINGTLFFLANDGSHGYELWKSDRDGATMVKDINPGANGIGGRFSNVELTNVNGIAYFRANDVSTGSELWRTDGTEAGTFMVRDINPGSFSSAPRSLLNVSGTLYFTAQTGDNRYRLWKSDGSSQGTQMVSWIQNGSPYIGSMTNVSGTLFFRANDGIHGSELWRTDGTDAGTRMVKNIRPGNLSSSPSSLVNVNGLLYFTADDGNNGVTLWKSDGTTEGTVAMYLSDALTYFLSPTNLFPIGNTLYYTMNSDQYGVELWRLISNVAPADILLSSHVLSENNSVNQVVGTLSTIDLDANNTFTYSLVSGDGDNDNGAFNIVGNQLRATNVFDYEARSTYSIRVRSQDQNGLSIDKNFAIVISDVYEDMLVQGGPGSDVFVATYTGSFTQASWRLTRNGAVVFDGPVFNGGSLVIDGLAGNDSLRVIGTLNDDQLKINSDALWVNKGSIRHLNIESITVFSDAGNDSLLATVLPATGVTLTFDAGAGNDRLETVSGDQLWNITGLNRGVLSNKLAFQNIESLQGGAGEDRFVFTNAGRVTGSVLGGGNFDIVDLSQKTNAQMVNLNANSSTSTGGIVNIEKFIGSRAAVTDTIIGANGTSQWIIDGINSGTIDNSVFGSVSFEGFESITGATGLDEFAILKGGRLDGILNGGTSAGVLDLLNLSDWDSALNVELASDAKIPGILSSFTGLEQVIANGLVGTNLKQTANTATSWAIDEIGNISVRGVKYSYIPSIIGGQGVDTLTGPSLGSSVNHWLIEASNRGRLTIPSTHILPGASLVFSNIDSLTGGTGDDAFEILPGGSLAGGIQGGLGAGLNSLSYAQWSLPVTVNLAVNTGSNASAIGGLVTNIQMITGGKSDDLLIGHASRSTLLIGLEGSDTLSGGSQKDVLIGGSGSDRFSGNAGSDLLVAGFTSWDTSRQALRSIHTEWISSRTFGERTANIWGNGTGPRFNGENFLNNAPPPLDTITDTVFTDADIDWLAGGLNEDWFLVDLEDTINDLSPQDRRNA
jgi:ELWxxDGT repeat protein